MKEYRISRIHETDSYYDFKEAFIGVKVSPQQDFETRGEDDGLSGWSHRSLNILSGERAGDTLYFFAVKLGRI